MTAGSSALVDTDDVSHRRRFAVTVRACTRYRSFRTRPPLSSASEDSWVPYGRRSEAVTIASGPVPPRSLAAPAPIAVSRDGRRRAVSEDPNAGSASGPRPLSGRKSLEPSWSLSRSPQVPIIPCVGGALFRRAVPLPSSPYIRSTGYLASSMPENLTTRHQGSWRVD